MSATVNKKYCLLTMFLLGGIITHQHVYAKSTSAHVISQPANIPQKQPQTNSDSASDAQDQDEPASRPQVGRILFSGNTKISSSELQKTIPLKSKDIANETIIMDSMVKIAQLYKVKNIKVTISPVLEKVSSNLTNIHFDIHEYPIDSK